VTPDREHERLPSEALQPVAHERGHAQSLCAVALTSDAVVMLCVCLWGGRGWGGDAHITSSVRGEGGAGGCPLPRKCRTAAPGVPDKGVSHCPHTRKGRQLYQLA
jgi:hypothetical protein